MKAGNLVIIIILLTSNLALSQTDLIFKNSIEKTIRLSINDTGLNRAGNFPAGTDINCISNSTLQQDCHYGRDATYNNPDDGRAGFSYTKLDSNGNSLPASAENWVCVIDNVTDLIWEVKTDDGSIHDISNKYQWGGITAIGRNHPERVGDYFDDWNILILESNDNLFCGQSNWRMPTVHELSDSVNLLAHDTRYFPFLSNIFNFKYWTASAIPGPGFESWAVFFDRGNLQAPSRTTNLHVRLVADNSN